MREFFRRLYAYWMRDEMEIREWERATGHAWIREGMVKKGGQNGPPRAPRPQPPRSQRPSPGTAEGRAKGGVARAEALTPERRAEIARNANAKRWKWS